jgi:hypothetical protein
MENNLLSKSVLNTIFKHISKDYDIPLENFKKYYKLIEKNTKNTNLCKARKQDGLQCTRKSKSNSIFCGKHIEKRKFGCMTDDNIIELTPFTYKGNDYFCDDFNIVYKQINETEDGTIQYKILGIKDNNIIQFVS